MLLANITTPRIIALCAIGIAIIFLLVILIKYLKGKKE